jgi:hypothetical protein
MQQSSPINAATQKIVTSACLPHAAEMWSIRRLICIEQLNKTRFPEDSFS